MATSTFQARVGAGRDNSRVRSFIPSQTAGQTFVVGSLVYFDTSANKIRLCGADPALILGLSEIDSEANRVITPDGRVPLYCIGPNDTIAMSCPTTLAESNVDRDYGVVNNSGIWQIDTTDTSAIRVRIRRVLTDLNWALVQFINTNLQFGTV